jgi:lipopolysaccharide export system permease protein
VVIKRKELIPDPQTGKETWSGKYDLICRAREARLRVVLPDGTDPEDKPMLYIDPDRWASVFGNAHIRAGGNQPIGVPLPETFTGKELKDRPSNLDWPALPPKAAEFRAKLEGELEQIAADRAALATETDPHKRDVLERHIDGLGYMVQHWQRQIRNTECEYYMRPALAVGCLVFAVIGCPVGMWANRADYLSAFVTCFLPTVCVYYPLLLAGSNMGRDGKLPMPIGVFASNVIVGLAAMVLTFKLIRR